MGDNGELRVLEVPKVETTALAALDDNINAGLAAALKEDYQALRPGGNRKSAGGMRKKASDRESPGAACSSGRRNTALFAAAGKIKCGGPYHEQSGKTGYYRDRKGALLSESGQKDGEA